MQVLGDKIDEGARFGRKILATWADRIERQFGRPKFGQGRDKLAGTQFLCDGHVDQTLAVNRCQPQAVAVVGRQIAGQSDNPLAVRAAESPLFQADSKKIM
jgi:hypothetical protein